MIRFPKFKNKKMETYFEMVFPKLYKMDNSGRIRIWVIEVLKMKGKWFYQQKHGLENGAIQATRTQVKSGKNIGKANETSIKQQCKAEALGIWTAKRDRAGYSEEIPKQKPFRPMLAAKYQDEKKKLVFPCYYQPKYNGARCLAIVINGCVTLKSRQDKVWVSVPHINAAMSKLPDGVYDGELYVHGPEFSLIMGALRRGVVTELSKKCQLWLYDFIDEKKGFGKRYKELKSRLKARLVNTDVIKLVPTRRLYSHDRIVDIHNKLVLRGYEGEMLRNAKGGYKINGRSKDLMKFKNFEDDEFFIAGALECKGKLKGACRFICKTKAGHTFKVMPKGSFAVRRQYWMDWKSGKINPGDKLTVRYIEYTTTDKPVPFHPVGLAIRNYE